MKRGDVFWIELEPRSGSEQRGRRPAIVVSHDGFNEVGTWKSVIVVPVSTSGKQARRGPSAVALSAGDGGLRTGSVALCHQVTTIDRGKVVDHVGRLSKQGIDAVDEGLRIALNLS